uniref:Uncharacterized protein n=1 Tax=Elaeophora elaphi TaxID=1147741 RepID=A0A0R3RSI0_9BILA
MEAAKIANSWKENEQHKLNFYKCEYEPIWERQEQMNYGKKYALIVLSYAYLLQDLCNSHYGKGAKVWVLQKTLTNSTSCIHKIHMTPCHSLLLEGSASKIYNNERVPPTSCGGLFGTPMPYEFITSERDIRAPQATNEMMKKIYMNQNVLASALHIQCPRCAVRSGWYA